MENARFTLPFPLRMGERQVMHQTTGGLKMKQWIGCSGWQYPEWEGIFYPKNLPKSRWFEFYASKFNTVEINYSFYHFPSEKTYQRWLAQAPKNFRYSIKAHRVITHYKKFKNTKKLIQDFYAKAESLEDKLGQILFQLPETFQYSEENLETILSQLNSKKPNVIEFRHSSWFQNKVQKAFQQNHITVCSVDAPKLPRQVMSSGKIFYLRMHGKKSWYKGNYTTSNLRDWLSAIEQKKFQQIWIYFNNDIGGYAPKNALSLNRLLQTSGGS